MKHYEKDVGADHRLMDWMIRRCSWVLNRLQSEGDERTACTHTRSKEHGSCY